MICGKLKGKELFYVAAIRELYEEIGIEMPW
ncbi:MULTISPECIES: NUDIX domain-containing protein [Pseudomonas]